MADPVATDGQVHRDVEEGLAGVALEGARIIHAGRLSRRTAIGSDLVAVDEVAEADLVVRAGLDLDRPDVPAGIEGGRLVRAGPLDDVVGPVEMEGDAGQI